MMSAPEGLGGRRGGRAAGPGLCAAALASLGLLPALSLSAHPSRSLAPHRRAEAAGAGEVTAVPAAVGFEPGI